MPFNSEPDAAYRVCMQRTCTQLVNGCLAKCPALAYWPQLETKAASNRFRSGICSVVTKPARQQRVTMSFAHFSKPSRFPSAHCVLVGASRFVIPVPCKGVTCNDVDKFKPKLPRLPYPFIPPFDPPSEQPPYIPPESSGGDDEGSSTEDPGPHPPWWPEDWPWPPPPDETVVIEAPPPLPTLSGRGSHQIIPITCHQVTTTQTICLKAIQDTITWHASVSRDRSVMLELIATYLLQIPRCLPKGGIIRPNRTLFAPC